jgi:hypothetical protein
MKLSFAHLHAGRRTLWQYRTPLIPTPSERCPTAFEKAGQKLRISGPHFQKSDRNSQFPSRFGKSCPAIEKRSGNSAVEPCSLSLEQRKSTLGPCPVFGVHLRHHLSFLHLDRRRRLRRGCNGVGRVPIPELADWCAVDNRASRSESLAGSRWR